MSARDDMTNLILEVFRLNGRLLVAGDALVADIGLTSARWQVLGGIALSSVPLPVAHIARNMGLARQGVQRLVNEMARDGLVRFGPNPHHQRAKLVFLTARGRTAFDAAMKRHEPWVGGLADGLSIKQIDLLTSTLKMIRERLETPSQEGGDNA